MKVVCIDNTKCSYPPNVPELVIGREYTVSDDVNSICYYLEEFNFGFYKSRFTTIKQYRKLKLKVLNNLND